MVVSFCKQKREREKNYQMKKYDLVPAPRLEAQHQRLSATGARIVND
jgi:hypothetical protein